ncbi:hypothetical protein MTsPCn9_10850 [Croceitalea sp. MTPC9]|uniref:sialate O-acetylesterase n=1 Tax=unclassified Croceitalea TaxID=2632280 RepID=UPI002B390D3E|nr:hypothetical protein MTsPCn6_26390 [Croceitalea sp. MTPC6]GMN16149.1 hypothetical protein MTsPCn9_10850 [Croceitalea sp. MTPC9]
MNFRILLILALAFIEVQAQDKTDFYLLLGQSNMAGRAAIRVVDTTELDKVFLVNDKLELEPAKNPLNRYSTIRKDDSELQRLGPGYSFGKELAKSINDTIVLFVNARGGTEIDRFSKGSEYGLYEATMNRLKMSLKKNPYLNLKGVLWQQGESDRNKSEVYLKKLKRFITTMRNDLKDPDLPFFIGEMGKWNKDYDMVRKELLTVESNIENVHLITSKDLTNFDEHHFDSKSQEELGLRYANSVYKNLYKTKKIEKPRTERILEKIKSNSNDAFVIAHRGDWRNAPENSIQAIENCIQMEVDIVEVDIAMTKDSVLVLMHDKTLDRTTKETGTINEKTYSEIKNLRLTNAVGFFTEQKIPTLQEALKTAKGKILLDLDIKGDIPFHLVDRILNDESAYRNVITRSYRPYDKALEYYSRSLKKLIYFPNISKNINDIESYIQDFEENINPMAYVPKFESDDSEILKYFNTILNNDDKIWIHTITGSRSGGHDDERAVNDLDGSYGWLLEKGVRIFQTDRPQLLIDYLTDKGLR